MYSGTVFSRSINTKALWNDPCVAASVNNRGSLSCGGKDLGVLDTSGESLAKLDGLPGVQKYCSRVSAGGVWTLRKFLYAVAEVRAGSYP